MDRSSPPQPASSIINDPINNPTSNSISTPPPTATTIPNPVATPDPDPDPDPAPTMALAATLPTYFNYNLNILCGPYPNPFFVHIFLGEIPHLINYQDPYSVPSWVGQGVIYPNPVPPPPPPPPAAAPHPPPTHPTPSPYTHQLSDASGPAPIFEHRPNPNPPSTAHPLPPTYYTGAVRSSQPLTSALVARLHAHSAAALSTATVTRYMQENLQWRLVGVGIPDRKLLDVERVPIRMWVVRQNVTPPVDDTHFPVYGPSVVVWEASRGKVGGLVRGELPGVG